MFTLGQIIKAVNGKLLSGDPNIRVSGVSIDSRTIKNKELFIAIKGNHFDGHRFIQKAIQKGAKAIIIQDLSYWLSDEGKTPYVKVIETRRALADLARFHRQRFNIPIVAITGSNGKTTTKDMLAWVLSHRMEVLKNPGTQNNDIGVSLSLLRLNAAHDIGILELGTNHFGEIVYLVNIAQPNLGIITNIGPAHLEYFGNLSGVYKEKANLLKGLKSPSIAILNADDQQLKRLIKKGKNTFIVTYGINNKCDYGATAIEFTSKNTIEFMVSPTYFSAKKILKYKENLKVHSIRKQKIKLKTIGYANVYNALVVIVVCRLFGLSYQLIAQRLASFDFIPGRLSLVKLHNIPFIDDSYNANPASLSEALGVLTRLRIKGRRILVMGDMLELGRLAEEFHRQAGVEVARVCDAFISVGKLAKLTAQWAIKFGLSKDCVFSCRSSQKAARLLFKALRPNCRDAVLVKGSRLMKMERVLK